MKVCWRFSSLTACQRGFNWTAVEFHSRVVVFRFFQARPQASTRSGKKNSFNRDSREEDKERKRKEERGGGGGAGEERKNTNIDRLARLDGAHTYTRRFFPPSLPS